MNSEAGGSGIEEREEAAALRVVQVRGGWGMCDAALFGIEKKSENSKNEHKGILTANGLDKLRGWRGSIKERREEAAAALRSERRGRRGQRC
jgi:hypothetical protein